MCPPCWLPYYSTIPPKGTHPASGDMQCPSCMQRLPVFGPMRFTSRHRAQGTRPGHAPPRIVGWDCGRAGMPTARTQYRYRLSSMVLLAVRVPRLCVVQQHTPASKHLPKQKWVYHLHFREGSHTVEPSVSRGSVPRQRIASFPPGARHRRQV